MSCNIGCRLGSDPSWLWLWPATIALIGLLAWEPPYAADATLKKPKKNFFLLTLIGYIILHPKLPKMYQMTNKDKFISNTQYRLCIKCIVNKVYYTCQRRKLVMVRGRGIKESFFRWILLSVPFFPTNFPPFGGANRSLAIKLHLKLSNNTKNAFGELQNTWK